MAIIVEDGTGKSDAETYVSVSDFDAYLAARGITLTTATDANKEHLLRKAAQYIETLYDRIQGCVTSETQALQFPRYELYLNGYYVQSDTIPQKLKDAQCQLAFDIESNDPFPVGDGRETIREKIDVIEVEYSSRGKTSVLPVFTQFEAMFRPFLNSSGWGGVRCNRV